MDACLTFSHNHSLYNIYQNLFQLFTGDNFTEVHPCTYTEKWKQPVLGIHKTLSWELSYTPLRRLPRKNKFINNDNFTHKVALNCHWRGLNDRNICLAEPHIQQNHSTNATLCVKLSLLINLFFLGNLMH